MTNCVQLRANLNLRNCCVKSLNNSIEEPNVQMKVIDGTAFVDIYRPKTSKTFGEYCDDELIKVIYSFSERVDRMDFVFDRYLENSMKARTRDSRGKA